MLGLDWPNEEGLQGCLSGAVRDQLSDEEEKRGHGETYARDFEFISLPVGQDPDDHRDRENRNDARTGKPEWHPAAADIASAQLQCGQTAENIKQQHRHVRQDRELLKR